MSKEEYLMDFQQGILDKIRAGEFSKIDNFTLGTMKFVLLGVDTPNELKRFAHIFSQCDMNDLCRTAYLLSRADFIKDIKFRYIKDLSFANNFKCLMAIQRIRIIGSWRRLFR